MIFQPAETTDGALLARLGDWADGMAWAEFVRRYDPEVRRHCRAFRFDPETLEEACQRIWIDLARCLRTYRYDPGRRFRAWLRRLCRSRAIDLYRQRKAEAVRRTGAITDELIADDDPADLDPDAPDAPDRPALLLRAERVQQAVRRRVDEKAWGVFWRIAVEGGAVREAADAAGLSYAAAFAAQKRVRRMLREEAARLESVADGETQS